MSNRKIPRVIVLGPLPPPYGGPEIMTRALVRGLQQREDIAITHINTQVSNSLADKGGKRQLRKSLIALRQSLQLIWRIITFRSQIVYLPLTNSPSFLGFLRDALFFAPAVLFGRKLVIRLHGGYYYYAHTTGFKRAIVKWFLARVDLAMVQGRTLREVYNGLVPPERIAVITNGLDGEPFTHARARANGAVRSPKQVLFVGVMSPDKGFRDVLKAAPFVPDTRFVFAGEWLSPREEEEVRDLVRRTGIEDRAIFPGVITGEAKYDLFASSDIFVFPSYYVYEGHAVCSVEALAAGLPIVCTDHGALNESVQDGWNGYFVKRQDPASIADRLNRILRDDALRQEMAERSRRLYEERFTLNHFVENWARAIKRCAADEPVSE
jgi:glycosyltransferase involved in cell wall biosynthesis